MRIQRQASKFAGIRENGPRQTFFVFPFEFVSGYIDNSNAGIQPKEKNPNPSNYAFFQKLFTGREILQITWSGSTSAIKPEGENYYDYSFRVGDFYLGVPLADDQSAQIEPSASTEDFLGMKTEQSITMKFYCNESYRYQEENADSNLNRYVVWLPKENDFFKLYIIPEAGNNKVFYISQCEYYRDQNTQLVNAVDITFTTLGDKLQNTGKAVEQYINFSAIGEKYAFPIIKQNEITDENGNVLETIRSVELDQERLKDNPITKVQYEFQGGAGITSLYMMGRNIDQDRINAPHHIFLRNIEQPTLNQVNRTSTPSQNFAWLPNCFPAQLVNVDYFDALKKSFMPTELAKDMGTLLTLGTDGYDGGALKEAIDKSNPADKENNLPPKNIFDTTWKPVESFGVDYTYETKGSPYCVEDMKIKQDDSVNDILAKNSLIYGTQQKLPMSYEYSKIFYSKDIPIVGTFLNMLKLGNFGIETTDRQQNIQTNAFVDIELINSALMIGSEKAGNFRDNSILPLEFFNENGASTFGTKGFSTMIKGELTDIVSINNVNYNTKYLGQTKYEDGTEIVGGIRLEANETLKVIQTPNTEGFIIDGIGFMGYFSGKVKLTFFNANDDQVFTTTIISESNWTGNPRDWALFFPLSSWNNNNTYQDDSFTYPEIIQYSKVGSTITKYFDIKYTKNVSGDWNIEPVFNSFWLLTDEIVEETAPNYYSTLMNNDYVKTETSQNFSLEITKEDINNLGYSSFDTFLQDFKYMHIDATKSFISLEGKYEGSYDKEYYATSQQSQQLLFPTIPAEGQFITFSGVNDFANENGNIQWDYWKLFGTNLEEGNAISQEPKPIGWSYFFINNIKNEIKDDSLFITGNIGISFNADWDKTTDNVRTMNALRYTFDAIYGEQKTYTNFTYNIELTSITLSKSDKL